MADDQEGASLRVVRLDPNDHPWMRADWLPTGEAVVMEFLRKHGEDFCETEERSMKWRTDK